MARGALPLDGVFPLAPTFDSLGFLAAGIEDLQLVLGIDDLPETPKVRVGRIGVDLEVPSLPDEHWTMFRKQVWDVHGERYRHEPRRYGRDLRWKFELPIGDVSASRERLDVWRARFLSTVEGFDVLVGPLLDGAAPTLDAAIADYERDEFLVGERLLRHTPVYNDLGWPALAVPTADGPIQVAARPGDEAVMLAIGRSLGLSSAEIITR